MINSSFKTIAQSIRLVITTVTRCQPVLRLGAFFLFHSKDEFQLLLGFVAVFFYFISFYSQIRFVLLSFLRSITWRNNTWRQPGFSISLLMILRMIPALCRSVSQSSSLEIAANFQRENVGQFPPTFSSRFVVNGQTQTHTHTQHCSTNR